MSKFNKNIIHIYYIKNKNGLYLKEIVDGIPVFIDIRRKAMEFENKKLADFTKNDLMRERSIVLYVEKRTINLKNISSLEDVEGDDY